MQVNNDSKTHEELVVLTVVVILHASIVSAVLWHFITWLYT